MIFYLSLSEHSHEMLSSWYLLPFFCLKNFSWRRKWISFQLLIYTEFGLYLNQFELHLTDSLTVWDLGLLWLQRDDSLLLLLFFLWWWIPLKLRRLFFFSSEVWTAVLSTPDGYDSTRVVQHCWSLVTGFQNQNLWHNLLCRYTNPHADYPYLMLAN